MQATATKRSYRSSWKPDPQGLPELRLQERDRRIIQLVYKFRYLDSDQIVLLYKLTYPLEAAQIGSGKGLKQRLKRLFHGRYLTRAEEVRVLRMLQGTSLPYVYGIGRNAIRLLVEKGHDLEQAEAATKSPGHRYLEHALAVTDFHVSLEQALHTSNWKIAFWRSEGKETRVSWTDRQGNSFSCNPDAFFCLRSGEQRMYYFFEADQGTMSTSRLRWKIDSFTQLWRDRRHAALPYQIPAGKPFKVLFSTISHDRAERLREIARAADPLQKGGLNLFWFTDASLMKKSPQAIVEPIWKLPSGMQRYSLLERHL